MFAPAPPSRLNPARICAADATKTSSPLLPVAEITPGAKVRVAAWSNTTATPVSPVLSIATPLVVISRVSPAPAPCNSAPALAAVALTVEPAPSKMTDWLGSPTTITSGPVFWSTICKAGSPSAVNR